MNKTDEFYEVHLGSDSQSRATYALRRQISQSEKLRHKYTSQGAFHVTLAICVISQRRSFHLLGSRSCKVVKSFKIPNSFTPSMSQFTIIRKHTEAFTRLRGFRLHGKLFIQLKSPFRSLLSRRRFHNGRK